MAIWKTNASLRQQKMITVTWMSPQSNTRISGVLEMRL